MFFHNLKVIKINDTTDTKSKGYIKPGAQTSGIVPGAFDYSIGVTN